LCRGDPIGAHAEASISNKLKRETLAATFFWRASRRWSWMEWRWRKFSQEAILVLLGSRFREDIPRIQNLGFGFEGQSALCDQSQTWPP
jgi:hypothetical protein